MSCRRDSLFTYQIEISYFISETSCIADFGVVIEEAAAAATRIKSC
jgi:hypothetical protein